MNDDAIKTLLQQRIDELKRLGISGKVRVNACLDQLIAPGEIYWTIRGSIRGVDFRRVCDPWDAITSDVIEAVGPRGLTKEVEEQLLSL